MNTDNRTNEPTPEQVEAAAKALHETRNPWFAAYGDWGAAGFEIKKAFRDSARAALVAAQGAARPVNSFDTTAEHVKTGANSLHVAPQEPNQNETKSGNNFVSLDPEKVADVLRLAMRAEAMMFEDGGYEWIAESDPDDCLPHIAHALCEAYTEGRLTK